MTWGSALLLILAAPATGISQGGEKSTGPPGYRPESDRSETFLKGVGSTSITVFPTIIRTRAGTSYDRATQGEIVRFIGNNELARAVPLERQIDPGELQGRFQWAVFQSGMNALGKQVVKEKLPSGFALIIEVLVTPTPSKGLAVGAIHRYVLDREGATAFSFLLNSQHPLFQDAALRTQDGSAKGQGELVAGAVRTILNAFKQQVADARP